MDNGEMWVNPAFLDEQAYQYRKGLIDSENRMLDIDFIAEKLLEVQKTLSPQSRLEAWNKIMSGYCQECGREDPGHNCQCLNDE